MSRWLLVGSLVLAACGSSPGGGGASPIVQSFVATPALLIGDGGVVELRWSVSGADSVSIDPGVGPVTPASGGTVSPHLSNTTYFTLTARGRGGDATSAAQVQVCDPAPGSLSGSCSLLQRSECTDYSGLGSSDYNALVAQCFVTGGKGIWATTPCPAPLRVGTCQVPSSSGTGISCSATAVIQLRYYPAAHPATPSWSTATAQGDCAIFPGSTFTPN